MLFPLKRRVFRHVSEEGLSSSRHFGYEPVDVDNAALKSPEPPYVLRSWKLYDHLYLYGINLDYLWQTTNPRAFSELISNAHFSEFIFS